MNTDHTYNGYGTRMNADQTDNEAERIAYLRSAPKGTLTTTHTKNTKRD